MSKVSKISLTNVSKAFGDNQVLKNLSLEVAAGDSVVIIGGSGTGKSVLVKCILGLLDVDKGRILIDGQDLTNPSGRDYEAFLKRTGMLFQGGALFDSLSVLENVAFGPLKVRGKPKAEAHEIALSKLGRVGLDEKVAGLYPAELSGGMKKRVALARAIATEPEIIFFDEPTTGLDPIMADVINSLITECVKDLGATTITITHDMSSVRKIADQAAMLHDGKIIWQGTFREIHSTKNPFVRQFVSGRAKGPIKVAGLSDG